MVRTGKGVKAAGDREALSVELPAPAGWKKFIPKNVGILKRNDVVFISPSGEEIRSKKQLVLYLRSHRGGPSSSEFDWGFGDTPRRSARLSEKTRETETAKEEPSKKRERHSVSKKATKKSREDEDSDVEDDSSEVEEPPKKREGRSTSKKGPKQKKISVDAEIEDEPPENEEMKDEEMKDEEMKAAEGEDMEDAEDGSYLKKDAVDADVVEVPESEKVVTQAVDDTQEADNSVDGKEEASAKAILEDSCANVDSVDASKQEKDYEAAEIEHEALGSVNIATEALESVEGLDVKGSEVEEAAAKAFTEDTFTELASEVGTKHKNDDVDQEVDGEAPESEKVALQALKDVEGSETIVFGDGSVKGEGEGDVEAIMEVNFSQLNPNDVADAIVEDEAHELMKMSTQSLDNVEEDMKEDEEQSLESVEEDMKEDEEQSLEGNEDVVDNTISEIISAEIDSNVKSLEEEDNTTKNVNQGSTINLSWKEENEQEKLVQGEPYKEDLCEEGDDEPLLNHELKSEKVSPSKANPTANCMDLKSPEKASALV